MRPAEENADTDKRWQARPHSYLPGEQGISLRKSCITAGTWSFWQALNAHTAIYHQWEQLEKSGCIDNFRILAEKKEALRTGWFFADSDAYKWLEAASRVLATHPDGKLQKLVQDFISLVLGAQTEDGYIYTYNQIHFPTTRWVNLQIEHELYCHGHLIEAGVTHFEATRQEDLLNAACKAADRIVVDFKGKGAHFTPGHEEIEIALLRLYQVSGEENYLDLASQFLAKRGRWPWIGLELLRQSNSSEKRGNFVKAQETRYREQHPHTPISQLPSTNAAPKPGFTRMRWFMNAFSGKLLQQHRPLKSQFVPVGHAVRFTYLKTAAAMVTRLSGKDIYRRSLEKSWQRMVLSRMYISGGVGALPEIEGFGRDHELHPRFAYAETCAALGSLFWNNEMAKLTLAPCYSDLFEWQLYNAALVGMGLDGKSYLYNNPLETDGEVQRRAWYAVPCCPSNLSRTFANLQNDIILTHEHTIFIQQYITSKHLLTFNQHQLELSMRSELPWQGNVEICLKGAKSPGIRLSLRLPSWAELFQVSLDGRVFKDIHQLPSRLVNPLLANWVEIPVCTEENHQLILHFPFKPRLLYAHRRVRAVRGKAAVSCGPLLYCLETSDNQGIDLQKVVLNPNSLEWEYQPGLLGGIAVIKGVSMSNQALTFIPYHLWGNRGTNAMTVFVNIPESNHEDTLAA